MSIFGTIAAAIFGKSAHAEAVPADAPVVARGAGGPPVVVAANTATAAPAAAGTVAAPVAATVNPAAKAPVDVMDLDVQCETIGYTVVARIPDFYKPGDDRITYWKRFD